MILCSPFCASSDAFPVCKKKYRYPWLVRVFNDGLNEFFVDVAPAPVFSRLEGLNDRVVSRVKVFRSVLVLGAVAATYMTTDEADTKVYPMVAHFQALLAALRGGSNFLDLCEV